METKFEDIKRYLDDFDDENLKERLEEYYKSTNDKKCFVEYLKENKYMEKVSEHRGIETMKTLHSFGIDITSDDICVCINLDWECVNRGENFMERLSNSLSLMPLCCDQKSMFSILDDMIFIDETVCGTVEFKERLSKDIKVLKDIWDEKYFIEMMKKFKRDDVDEIVKDMMKKEK